MKKIKNKKIKIAVFDIDGTIFRSSLLIEYIHELVRLKVFPSKALKEVFDDQCAWLDRKESYDKYIMSIVRVHQKYIKGAKVEKVNNAIKNVINEQKDRNYKYTKNLIADLRKKGYILIAVSGSPHDAVMQFAKYLKFDYWFGQLYEKKNGKYTGNVIYDNSIFRKDVVIDMWSKDNGFTVDYKNSYAVGDSAGDISILTKVGHSIAFNPNSELAKVAKKNNWKIVVERKDVIYDLANFKTIVL